MAGSVEEPEDPRKPFVLYWDVKGERMEELKTAVQEEPRIGSRWRDKDPRLQKDPRIVEVVKLEKDGVYIASTSGARRITRVALSRFYRAFAEEP